MNSPQRSPRSPNLGGVQPALRSSPQRAKQGVALGIAEPPVHGALKGRHGRWLLSLGPAFCLAACLCAGVATLTVCTWSTVRQMERVAKAHRAAEAQRTCGLPGPERAVRTETATPAQQAAAGNQVVANTLARALAQAAADGNTKAVEDITKGLPCFGDVARQALMRELRRCQDTRVREALRKALDEL